MTDACQTKKRRGKYTHTLSEGVAKKRGASAQLQVCQVELLQHNVTSYHHTTRNIRLYVLRFRSSQLRRRLKIRDSAALATRRRKLGRPAT